MNCRPHGRGKAMNVYRAISLGMMLGSLAATGRADEYEANWHAPRVRSVPQPATAASFTAGPSPLTEAAPLPVKLRANQPPPPPPPAVPPAKEDAAPPKD